MRNLKPENDDHALTKAPELQAYLELEERNPIGTAIGSSPGVNHMKIQFPIAKTQLFLTNLSGRPKETPITFRRIATEDHARILVAESEKETAPWTEARMTHERTEKADSN